MQAEPDSNAAIPQRFQQGKPKPVIGTKAMAMGDPSSLSFQECLLRMSLPLGVLAVLLGGCREEKKAVELLPRWSP